MKTYDVNSKNNTIFDEAIFDEFATQSLPGKGKHSVKLVHCEMVPAVVDSNGEVRSQPYVSVNYKDTRSGDVITSRIYSKAVPYFMENLNKQFKGDLMGMKFSQILNYIQKHAFEIWLDWDQKYGVQVRYYDEAYDQK